MDSLCKITLSIKVLFETNFFIANASQKAFTTLVLKKMTKRDLFDMLCKKLVHTLIDYGTNTLVCTTTYKNMLHLVAVQKKSINNPIFFSLFKMTLHLKWLVIKNVQVFLLK